MLREIKGQDELLSELEHDLSREIPDVISSGEYDAIRVELFAHKPNAVFIGRLVANLKACFGDDPRGLQLLRDWLEIAELGDTTTEEERQRLLTEYGSEHGPDDFVGLEGPTLRADWQRICPPRTLTVEDLLQVLKRDRKLTGHEIEWKTFNKATGEPSGRCQLNIKAALRHLNVKLYKNEFDGRFYIEGFEDFHEVSDETINALWLRVDAVGLKTPKDFFENVIREIARQDKRHPLKRYLEECEQGWDEVPRLEEFLIKHAGVEDTPLNREFTRLTFTAAAARVFEPGIKFDQMLVLQSDEGTKKSSLFSVMAGDEYFSDCATLGQSPKEMIEHTRGIWFLEVPELDTGKREVEPIKAMLSRRVDRAALKYEKMATAVPRAFIIVGTTNKDKVTNSDTGARRFWPMRVKQIDLEAIGAVRDQLWGEAVHLWKKKGLKGLKLEESFWPEARELQRQKSSGNPIHEMLAEELEGKSGRITTEDMWAVIGYGPDKKAARKSHIRDQMHEGAVRLGWESTRFRDGLKKPYGYAKQPAPRDSDGYLTDDFGNWEFREGQGLFNKGFPVLGNGDDTVVQLRPARSGAAEAMGKALCPTRPSDVLDDGTLKTV